MNRQEQTGLYWPVDRNKRLQEIVTIRIRGLQRLLETLVGKHLQALYVKNPSRRLSFILSPVVETYWWTKSEMHSLGLNGWSDAVGQIMHILKIAKCWPLLKPKEDLMMTYKATRINYFALQYILQEDSLKKILTEKV